MKERVKIYADFESPLKGVRGSNKNVILHTLKNIRHTFLAVLPTMLFVLMINLVNQLFFYRRKIAINRFIEAILEKYDYCKKVKNLVMSAVGLLVMPVHTKISVKQ